MSEPSHGPFHRTGEPGGPAAEVAALPVEGRGPEGEPVPAYLLDAQGEATEVELLRAICHALGVSWGHDDFGWWAAVPAHLLGPERE